MPRHLVFRFPFRLAAWVVALCAFLGAMAVPGSARATILYTDFDTWKAAAGETINTQKFGFEDGQSISGLTLQGGTTLEFSGTFSALPNGVPDNISWGGSNDADVFISTAQTMPVLSINLSNNNTGAGGFWITKFDDQTLSNFTYFTGWIGQGNLTISIGANSDSSKIYIGDFYESKIPEPAPLLLLGLGWLAWLGVRKLRSA